MDKNANKMKENGMLKIMEGQIVEQKGEIM